MENDDKPLRTRKLEVVDDRGTPRIVLTTKLGSPTIELRDRYGSHRAELALDPSDECFEARFYTCDLVAAFQIWPDGKSELYLSPHGGPEEKICLNEALARSTRSPAPVENDREEGST